jgi:hypothetical protein
MHRQLFILACFFVGPKLIATPIIQLSLEPDHQEYAQRILKKLKKGVPPSFSVPIESGIIATYAGFIDTADFDGLISFPRKQTHRSIFLLITSEAIPIRMFHNTLSHWELVPGEDAQMYFLEQKKDEKTGTISWYTEKQELPQDKKIPSETIILFIKPKHVHVEQNPVLVHDNENLILPPIKISKGIDMAKNAIFILKIRHFFGNTMPTVRKQSLRYEITLKP